MLKRDEVREIQDLSESLYEYLYKFEDELSDIIAELHDADAGNALDVCRDVAERLSEYYNKL